MTIIIGTFSPEWGHTALAEGFGKLYALRSLQGGSSLCVFDMPADVSGIVSIDQLTPKAEFRTPGKHSCYITLLDRQAVLSDYTSGTLTLFELDSDGMPTGEPGLVHFEGNGPDPVRQTSPHIHSSWVAPDGKSIIVVDLGCDRLYRFAVNAGRLEKSSMEVFSLPAGCGPRHCTFNHDGTILYVATELSDEVLVYSYPAMELIQRCITNDNRPRGGGHIVLSPDGRYLYVSSRLDNDGIAVFRISDGGTLNRCGYHTTGAHPRHFAVSADANELVCATRDGNTLEVFSICPETGTLYKKEQFIADKPVFVILK